MTWRDDPEGFLLILGSLSKAKFRAYWRSELRDTLKKFGQRESLPLSP